MKNILSKTNLWRGIGSTLFLLFVTLCLVTAVMFENSGLINTALKLDFGGVQGGTGETYYESKYGELNTANLAKLIADADKHNTQLMEEGAVLVKNNGALPLATTERNVTLFGRAVASPLYKAGGAGPNYANSPRLISLRKAFETAGFSINAQLFDAYAAAPNNRSAQRVGEMASSFYTPALISSFTGKKDAAIVMFARQGGEGNDLSPTGAQNDNYPVLALHPNEQALLKSIKNDWGFTKTIVLINSGHMMDLDWVDKTEYGVDACLWIGGVGLTGLTGVPNILTGAANPSGRFADTYAADQRSSPAMKNFGDFTFANITASGTGANVIPNGNKYVLEAEGIYWGYHYYETRYEDSILNPGSNASGSAGIYKSSGASWNYADEMAYPFGYGLSYTTFSQELQSVTWNRTTKKVTAAVKVKNTGIRPGKFSVQLYVQTPYTEYDKTNFVEKSAIQLLDFGKTGVLARDAEEVITITADEYLFASYDYKLAKGYIYDAGDYYFAVGDNVHDALNNILAVKGATGMYDHNGQPAIGKAGNAVKVNLAAFDGETYKNSQYTGQRVTNAFTENGPTISGIHAKANIVDINEFIPDTVTYLTRRDWNTYPISYSGDNAITATADMINLLKGKTYTKPANAPAVSSFTTEAKNGINFIDMKGVPLSGKYTVDGVEKDADEQWEKFLDQLTLTELVSITSDNASSPTVKSVNKPKSINNDGPGGVKSTYKYDPNNGDCTLYVDQLILGYTWNKELVRKHGDFLAEDALFSGVQQLWSGGANMHRTPYSGRNGEYWSEDAIFSYICNAIEAKAMQERGLMCALKHYAANDQETNRNGVATFMNEQALRQLPLKGFEGAFTVGGAMSTMTAYNRVGVTAASANYALLTQTLRNEWGFKGANITDASGGQTSYMFSAEGIVAGTDMWCLDGDRYKSFRDLVNGGDGYIMQHLRKVNKRFYYAFLQTNLINGLASDTVVKDPIAWWQPTVIVIDCVFGAMALAALGLFGWGIFKKRREAVSA